MKKIFVYVIQEICLMKFNMNLSKSSVALGHRIEKNI